MSRAWVGVVSLQHAMIGVAQGFTQLCHGKQAPLRRMGPGDWLVLYSPKDLLNGKTAVQAFTAVGRVRLSPACQVQLEAFSPFRRDVDYLACRPASIQPLLPLLSFTQGRPNWGFLFRRGHFELGLNDFWLIAQAMGVDASPGCA